MQVKSLDHIHIYAADPEASVGFYQRHFEAQEIHRNINNNGDARIFLKLGGQVLVLGSFPEGMAAASPPEAADGAYPQGYGVAHFGLRVEDVAVAIEELSGAGVQILSETVTEANGLSYVYVAAPDGVVVELTQYESR